MKKFSQEGKLSNEVVESIMSEEKPRLATLSSTTTMEAFMFLIITEVLPDISI